MVSCRQLVYPHNNIYLQSALEDQGIPSSLRSSENKKRSIHVTEEENIIVSAGTHKSGK